MASLTTSKTDNQTSKFWKHHLSDTDHLSSISAICTNSFGWIALAGEDQTISVVQISELLKNRESSSLLTKLTSSSRIPHHLSCSPGIIKIHEHTLPITDVYLTNDNRVLSISKDQSLKISDIVSQTRLASITFPSSLNCLAISPSEDYVYLGSQDSFIYKIYLWGINQKESDWNQNESSLLNSHFLREWDQENSHDSKTISKESNIYRGHTMSITKISISQDGSRIVSSSLDGYIIVWDEATFQPIHKIQAFKNPLVWSQTMLTPRQKIKSSKRKTNEIKSNLPLLFQDSPNQISFSIGAYQDDEEFNFIEEDISFYMTKKLKQSTLSEIGNLKEENAKLKVANEKWKEVNNSLFSSSLNSVLK